MTAHRVVRLFVKGQVAGNLRINLNQRTEGLSKKDLDVLEYTLQKSAETLIIRLLKNQGLDMPQEEG